MASIPKLVPWQRIGKTVGGGGQSTVHEVEPKPDSGFPSAKYAMKELKNVSSNQAQARFLQEIDALKQIKDPRIVNIIDHHKDNASFLYYVMPYDENFTPLEKIIFSANSPFRANPKACLDLVAECAEALHKVHEHENRIVHRDLNPANILYNSKTKKPLIIDFGCCQMEGDHKITLVDEGVGTPNYMARECEAGAAAGVTSKSDIYSLGKILWSMVAGYKTFARENPAFTNKNLKNVLPDNPDCWHLTRIFQKTIRENPKRRYENAEKLAEDCRYVIYLIDHHPPLERVMSFCPACGEGELVLKDRNQGPVQMHQVFGHLPQGCEGFHCPICGYISVWDTRVLNKRKQELSTMD